MDSGKTKNFIILLLLLLNLSFLGIMINDHLEESRHLRQANEQVVTRLGQQEITLNAAQIPRNRAQEAAFLSRETQTELAFLILPDGAMLTLDGYAVINRQAASGEMELRRTDVWEEIQRYTINAPLDVQTALILLGVHLEEQGISGMIASVQMGYYLAYNAALIEFRPVWYAETDTARYSIDRQSGEIRMHD